MSDNEELKCPVCGGRAVPWGTLMDHYWVACEDRQNCRLEGPWRGSWKEAIAAWKRLKYEPEIMSKKSGRSKGSDRGVSDI